MRTTMIQQISVMCIFIYLQVKSKYSPTYSFAQLGLQPGSTVRENSQEFQDSIFLNI